MIDPAGDTERGTVSPEAAELIARIRGGQAVRDRPASDDGLDAQDFHGRYTLVRQLGEGAMGTVWQATDKKLRRIVAVKFLKPELQKNPIVVERAIAEARAASQARHEHIVEIFDVGTMPDGSIYTVMEWLEGRTLSSIIEESGGLPWKRCRGLLLQLARAMAHAHACGITHRDLKPDNILVCERPTPDFCKVIDFGLSKDAALEKRLTQTGQLLGTPYYMSPEQVLGRAADRRSDVYGLGVIAFELVTGDRPFEGDSVYAVFTAHVEGPIPHVPEELDTVGRDIDRTIRRALAKDPEERFASMDELIENMQSIPDEFPSEVPPLAPLPIPAPTVSRSRRWIPFSLLATVATAGLVVFLAWPSQDAEDSDRPFPTDVAGKPRPDPRAAEPALEATTSQVPAPRPEEPKPKASTSPSPGSASSEGAVTAPASTASDGHRPPTSASASRKRGGRRRNESKPQAVARDPLTPPPEGPPKPKTPSSKADEVFDELGKLDGSRDETEPKKKPELLGE